MTRQQKDSAIAAAITFGLALLLLLLLFSLKMGWNREALAEASIPEPQEEELFLEPELLTEAGQEETQTEDQPVAPLAGEPEPAPEPQPKVVEKLPDPTPKVPKEKVITQTKPSPVQETPPKGEEEKKRAAAAVANKFGGPNGSVEGKFETSGGGESAVGVTGTMNGRRFLGCPKPDVKLRHKTVVKVEVTVDAAGKVISASATGGASAEIRRACENAARQARWSEKKGAVSTRGSITFTITPK